MKSQRKGQAKSDKSNNNEITTTKLVSQWEGPMREFCKRHEEKCNSVNPVAAPSTHTIMDFPTGSSYEGAYEDGNMRGYGEYTYPNGVVYRGQFEDGMCHGDGELLYENGEEFTIIRGKWEKGVMNECRLLFNGILEYNSDDWQYCKMPDRRYSMEFNKELKPAGKSNITAEQPPRKIPPGYLDNGYGFYNPDTKTVYKYHNYLDGLKAVSERERIWIEQKCRIEATQNIGPCPDLYENWVEPDANPPPLPKLLVGFTDDQQSMFTMDADTDSLFYDATNWNN